MSSLSAGSGSPPTVGRHRAAAERSGCPY